MAFIMIMNGCACRIRSEIFLHPAGLGSGAARSTGQLLFRKQMAERHESIDFSLAKSLNSYDFCISNGSRTRTAILAGQLLFVEMTERHFPTDFRLAIGFVSIRENCNPFPRHPNLYLEIPRNRLGLHWVSCYK